MLEGKGIVEDVGVGDGWSGCTDLLEEGTTAGALKRFFEEKSTRLVAHEWDTGLAAATAANAATANVSFIAFNRQLRMVMLEKKEEWNEDELYEAFDME